jgi:hypothetical protein
MTCYCNECQEKRSNNEPAPPPEIKISQYIDELLAVYAKKEDFILVGIVIEGKKYFTVD